MDIIKQAKIYPLIKPVETALLKRADLIVVTSPQYRDGSRPLRPFVDKVKVVPNAMNEEDFVLRPGDEEEIQKLKTKYGHRKIVFFIGRHIQYKGLPYALIEAASVGLPIIASNVKGNNEVVFNNKNGFLFQSEEEAIDIMRMIVNDDVNYKQLSFESIALFKQYFTDKIMLAKLIDLYNNIIL